MECGLFTGLNGYGCNGQLTIDGVVMHSPAWDLVDLTPLWTEVTVRGQDRSLPGLAGVIPYRRRWDVTEHALEFLVIGEINHLGTLYADPWVGLETNIFYLRQNVIDPTNVGDGTRPASLTLPSGTVLYANVHVLGLRLSETAGDHEHAHVIGALQISIPTGAFIPAVV